MIQSKPMADGGINNNMRGPTYQMRLLELFAVTSTFANLDFKLTTELVDAMKFDDVVLNYKTADGKTKVRLLQAKHRNNPKAVNMDFLLTNKDFSMHKYFVSLLDIKDMFPDIDIEDLILASNNHFSKTNESFLQIGKGEYAICLEKIEASDICLNGIGERFKLVGSAHQERDANFQVIKNYLLATELCDVMLTAGLKDLTAKRFPVLNAYRKFVFENVLDDTFKLRPGFIDGSDGTLTKLRKFFEMTFNSNPKSESYKQFKDSKCRDIWDFIKGYKNLDVNLNKFFGDATLSVDEGKTDAAINEFLDKFVYLVNADIDPIHESIIKHLESKFGQNAHIYYGILEFKIKQWLTDRKTTEPINAEFVRGCFDEMNSINLEFHTTELFKKHQNIQFKFPIPGWDENLLVNKMLCLVTSEGETSLSCIKVYQFLANLSKTVLYFKTDDPKDYIEKCLSNFNNFFDCCLIEVTTDLTYEIPEIDKNVIFVTHDSKFIKNVSIYEIKNENSILCEDLTDESLEKIYNKNVWFQGKSILLKKLMDDKFMETYGKGLKISDIINLTQIAGNEEGNLSLFDPSFYITRTILQKHNIKISILKDWDAKRFSDILTFSEGEFSEACSANPDGNVHLLKKVESSAGPELLMEDREDNEKLIWLKSQNRIAALRQYVDETSKLAVEIDEASFCKSLQSINIITDSAGMGKSMLFENMKRMIKNEIPDKWIFKIDLNNYTEVFDSNLNKNSLNSDDLERMLINDMLKLNSIVDIEIFKYVWKSSGNLVVFFDGYDEVGRD
jgi:hypothetical protein